MSQYKRREFLKTTAGATAGAAFAGAPAVHAQTWNNQPEKGAKLRVLRWKRFVQGDEDAYMANVKKFTAKTGIEVRVVQAEGNQLLERLKAEGEYANADVVITVDAGNLDRLVDADLLQPAHSPTLDAVPAHFRDEQNRWFGFLKRARVIVYAKGVVDPAQLVSMDTLATPAFKGKVCARTSTNLYNLSMMAARIEREGADKALAWARGVAGNFARQPQGSDSDQLRAVAAGQCQVAIANHYYLVRFRRSEDPADRAVSEKLGVVFPDQAGPNGQGVGTHVNISGAGLATHARNRANALQLLEFLSSTEAQQVMSDKNNELPVASGVTLSPELAALGTFKEETVNFSAFGGRQPEAQRLFDEAGWK